MFRDYLQSLGILSEIDLSMLDGETYEKSIPKNGFFLKEGELAREVAFIVNGEFRVFYYNSKGEEVTSCFALSNSIITSYYSFITNEDSQESIQALSDTQLICISRDTIFELEKKSTNWLKLSKFIAEQEYINLEKRILLLQKETADKRYAELVRNQPELLQLVSLEQLSSYLGISSRHLSRIRGRKSK